MTEPTDGLFSILLDYEIRSSWWAGWISNAWLQDLAGRYFAWKVNRKIALWMTSRSHARRYKE